MDVILNLAAILKNQNINFNFKFIADSSKNISNFQLLKLSTLVGNLKNIHEFEIINCKNCRSNEN
jgi:hypothetical protein